MSTSPTFWMNTNKTSLFREDLTFDVLPCFAFAHAHQLVKIRGFHRFVIKLRDANSCEIKTNGFHVDNLENVVRKSSETMDDLENVPDKVNFVPCVKWVRRGKAKARPDKVQLDQSELAAIIEQTRSKLEESERDAEDDDEGEDEEDENEAQNGEEKMDSEKVKQESEVKVKVEDGGERDIEAEYDLDKYDEEDKGGGASAFGIGDLVFDPKDDEYQQEAVADDDASDAEDFEIRPTDNLILVGHVEGDASILEVYGKI